MKWIIRLICVLALCASYRALSSFCKEQTGGFTIANISSNLPFHPEWEMPPLTPDETGEVHAALGQKYHYLFSGGQAVVFMSEDQQYVIKFFDQSRFKPRFLVRYLPNFCFNAKKLAKRQWKRSNKMQRDFNSYKIAMEELKQETGLMYVHLNQTASVLKPFTLVDQLNIAHEIDLNRFEFVLQKRADLVYPHLESLCARGEKLAAKEALQSLLELFTTRCAKGIEDSIPDLDKNFGFIGTKAVQIDTGRFTKQHLVSRYRDRRKAALQEPLEVKYPLIKDSFKAWLGNLDPELLEYFEAEYFKRA